LSKLPREDQFRIWSFCIKQHIISIRIAKDGNSTSAIIQPGGLGQPVAFPFNEIQGAWGYLKLMREHQGTRFGPENEDILFSSNMGITYLKIFVQTFQQEAKALKRLA
jgi:hypothetical protein